MGHYTDEYKKALKIIRIAVLFLIIALVTVVGTVNEKRRTATSQLLECQTQLAECQDCYQDLEDEQDGDQIDSSAFDKYIAAEKDLASKYRLEYHRAEMEKAKVVYETKLKIMRAEHKTEIEKLWKKFEKGSKSAGSLQIKNNWKWEESKGDALAYGRVINKSQFIVTSFTLQFVIKDKDKNVVNSAFREYKNISLSPNQAIEFWIRAEKHQQYYEYADIYIVHVVYEHRS